MAKERLIFLSPADPAGPWRRALGEVAPDVEFVLTRGEVDQPETIDWAVVWKPPAGLLARLPNLKCVFSIAAGIDHLTGDPKFPDRVPLARAIDPCLTGGMGEYVVLNVLAHHRELPRMLADQAARRWAPFLHRPAKEARVGLMGFGELGLAAARLLKPFGYPLAGWSASRKSEPGVESFAGMDELPVFLARTDILICLLPLTSATRGILNRKTLSQLPRGARLISAGRGAHLVEADLLEALDSGQIAAATLDVFETEPLPEASPLWHHPNVLITPHIAGYTDPRSAAPVIADSMARVRRGEAPLHLVDLARGY